MLDHERFARAALAGTLSVNFLANATKVQLTERLQTLNDLSKEEFQRRLLTRRGSEVCHHRPLSCLQLTNCPRNCQEEDLPLRTERRGWQQTTMRGHKNLAYLHGLLIRSLQGQTRGALLRGMMIRVLVHQHLTLDRIERRDGMDGGRMTNESRIFRRWAVFSFSPP